MFRKICLSLVFYLVAALGMSLTIKAQIGVSSFNALNITLSEWLHITIGNITGCLNGSFLIFSYLIDPKRNKKEYGLMILSLIFFSYSIDFFIYTLLSDLNITSYSFKIGVFILGTCLAGIGTGRIVHYGILKFPIEKSCQLLEQMTHKSFAFFRYSIDIICVSLSLFISLITHTPLFVREGTLISLFLLSYVINKSKNYKEKQ